MGLRKDAILRLQAISQLLEILLPGFGMPVLRIPAPSGGHLWKL